MAGLQNESRPITAARSSSEESRVSTRTPKGVPPLPIHSRRRGTSWISPLGWLREQPLTAHQRNPALTWVVWNEGTFKLDCLFRFS
jgi:hypothetical protein